MATEKWKCVDPELEWQIRCFPYGEHSDVPRLQQVEQKAVGRQRNLGLVTRERMQIFWAFFADDNNKW